MTDQFDKDLAALYQQRKAKIDTPEIKLPESQPLKSGSIWRTLSILLAGSLCSFGILAIITHFAKGPNIEVTPQLVKHQVVVIPDMPINKKNSELKRVAPLPKEPNLNLPTKNQDRIKPDTATVKAQTDQVLDFTLLTSVDIPQLNKPESDFEPVFKIMPDYPLELLRDSKTGYVKLSYQVNTQGEVININVVESEGDRRLKRAAQRALAKWRYHSNSAPESNFEILFEFKLPE